MPELPSLRVRIQNWTREAVLTWGDDWTQIDAHIERRLSALSPRDRRDIDEEATLTLIGADERAQH